VPPREPDGREDEDDAPQKNERLDRLVNFLATYLP
jgi:hypothetical protein